MFKYLSAVAIKKALIKSQTASDYTVYVTGLPNEYAIREEWVMKEDGKEALEKIPLIVTARDVEEHFAQYGKVVEISFARKFGKMMDQYK